MISGGSANGERSGGSIGEYTVVASAKRGVLGTLSESREESDERLADVRVRTSGGGRLLSVMAEMVSALLLLLDDLHSLDMVVYERRSVNVCKQEERAVRTATQSKTSSGSTVKL